VKDILSVKEFAEKSGVSTATIYKKIRSGELKCEIHNGRKFVVCEIGEEPETIELFTPAETREVHLLRKRVFELENYTKLFENLLEENSRLKEENQELTQRVIEKIDNLELQREPIEACEYLVQRGFTKKERNRILKELKEKDDKRILERDGKLYLDLSKYSFLDLIVK
jgi:hypothetical protein